MTTSKRNGKPYPADLIREAVAAGTWVPPTTTDIRRSEAKRLDLQLAIALSKVGERDA